MSEKYNLLPPDKPTRSDLIPVWENLMRLINTLDSNSPDIDGWARFFLKHDTDLRPHFGPWNFRDLILRARWDIEQRKLRGWTPTWATSSIDTACSIDQLPGLPVVLEHMCNLIADNELNVIGDRNPTSHFVKIIPAMIGGPRFIRCLKHFEHLELTDYKEESGYDSESCIKTYLLRISRPSAFEDTKWLASQIRQLNFSEDRLLQVLSFNPLWSRAVAAALESPDIESLAWFYYHHAGKLRLDNRTYFPLSAWATLPEESYDNGGLDLQWLDAIRSQLGDNYFFRFLDLAMVSCSSSMSSSLSYNNRLVYCCEAYMGKCDRPTVFKRARTKRHQDSIHAVGLLPLSTGVGRNEDLSQRLQLLREIRHTRKKVGAERRSNEAARIEYALSALAHQLKDVDSSGLWWKAEADEIALLSGDPLCTRLDDLVIELHLNCDGLPSLYTERKGKTLKTVPVAAKKDAVVADLLERHRLLKVKHRELVLSFEEAMINRVAFNRDVLSSLAAQPLILVIIRRLVWIDDRNGAIGYPDEKFEFLFNPVADQKTLLSTNAQCRVAHPCDLESVGLLTSLETKHRARNVTQPFQQLEREYVSSSLSASQKTAIINELIHKKVEPLSLGGKTTARGWRMHNASEPLEFRRKFQQHGVWAALIMDGHFFNAQHDLDLLSVADIEFLYGPQLEQLPLDKVPVDVLSETIRDVRLFLNTNMRNNAT